MSLRERQRQMTIAMILEGAERVFARRGFHGASMEEIAREAGCAPATLYGYFKGKRQLFQQLLADRSESFLAEAIEACGLGDDFISRWGSFTNFLVRRSLADQALMQLLLSAMRSTDRESVPSSHPPEEVKTAYHGVVAQLVQDGIAEGALRQLDAHVFAVVVLGALHAVILAWAFQGGGSEALSQSIDHASSLLLDGARNR